MKKIPLILGLATLLLAAFALPALTDDSDEPERRVKLKIAHDDDKLDLDLGTLEVGDSQQFFTDGGKSVLVTRTEDAFKIEIEGKDEPIIVKTGGPHGEHDYAYAGDDDGAAVMIKKKIVRKCDDDDSDCESPSMVFISKDGEMLVGDVGEENVWVGAGEGHGAHVVKIRAHGAAQRLIDSGVLDDLPEAKRQEILEALGGDEHHGVMVIDAEVHEEHGEHEDH